MITEPVSLSDGKMLLAPRRLKDLISFYELLDHLAALTGGPSSLSECSSQMPWLKRGVYFFYEEGELRCESGSGLRILRVGTHAVSKDSRTTLRKRLSQHRGTTAGSGNHRGSILLSNYGRLTLDAPSASWLGRYSQREPVVASGLWNQDHLDGEYDERFLQVLKQLVG